MKSLLRTEIYKGFTIQIFTRSRGTYSYNVTRKGRREDQGCGFCLEETALLWAVSEIDMFSAEISCSEDTLTFERKG